MNLGYFQVGKRYIRNDGEATYYAVFTKLYNVSFVSVRFITSSVPSPQLT